MQHADLICHRVTQTVAHCTVDPGTFHGYLMTYGIALLMLWVCIVFVWVAVIGTNTTK